MVRVKFDGLINARKGNIQKMQQRYKKEGVYKIKINKKRAKNIINKVFVLNKTKT